MNTQPASFRVTPQVILGLLIVAFGLLLTADNLGYADAGDVIRYWPLLLVAVGVSKVTQSEQTGGRIFGGILILIGLSTTADTLFNLRVDFSRWWPLLMVAMGGLIIYRSFKGEGGQRDRLRGRTDVRNVTDGSISEFSVWSGKVRRVSSPAFRQADLTAIMGGIEFDLRGASTGGQEAVIDVFVWWGGIEIKVPPDWAVSNKVVAVMGGADDKSSGTQDATNRLVVRGFVVMGGVEIKT